MSENAEDSNSESQLQINAAESSQHCTHRDSELLVCVNICVCVCIYVYVCVYVCAETMHIVSNLASIIAIP